MHEPRETGTELDRYLQSEERAYNRRLLYYAIGSAVAIVVLRWL